ncbi:hypothetical protein [Sanguibacter sp. HDW7]|uniref:hypothetical protein n=1 Tax=Sanguibacter sp. HDW7 TaxID=2714931 RepID=UPI0014082AFE|nr:hypothetical protein [Sanguibacter sp. HDW7]QIK84451.1 hypothetical protein G7063_13120 [Sanguibacter sp. HDW7]
MIAVIVGGLVALLVLLAGGGTAPGRGDRRPHPVAERSEGAAGSAVEVLLMAVAASLRAGSPPAHAWARAGVLATPDGVPHAASLALQLEGGQGRGSEPGHGAGPGSDGAGPGRDAGPGPGPSVGADGAGPPRVRRARGGRSAAEQRSARVAALVAACRVAVRLGSPLADTLEHVGREAVAAETRAARRDAALAGPRATARLLAWLPLLGVLVASLLGADPVSTVLGGRPGAASVIVGLGVLAAGRRWIALLVRQAERA